MTEPQIPDSIENLQFNLSAEQMTTRFNTLKDWKRTALQNDAQELENAKSKLVDCDKVTYDSDAVQRMKQDMEGYLEMLFEHLGQAMPPIIKMREHFDDLRPVVHGWQGVINDLTGIREEMTGLGIEEWLGSAGEAYRQSTDGDKMWTDKHLGLANNAFEGINSVALVQAYIVNFVVGELLDVSGKQDVEDKVNEPPKQFTDMSHDDIRGQEFYSRTSKLIWAVFQLFNTSYRLSLGDPWRGTAEDIAASLSQAVTEHRAGQEIKQGSYDRDFEFEGDGLDNYNPFSLPKRK